MGCQDDGARDDEVTGMTMGEDDDEGRSGDR